MIDPSDFKIGMRRLAAGVSIVTTMTEDVPHGLVATSVTSVSAAPLPSLLVCVNRTASAHDMIHDAGAFCVNVLGNDDCDIAQAFAGGERSARFNSPRWNSLKTGSPSLSSALCSLDCRLEQAISFNSHTIFVGGVVALQVSSSDMPPLLYFDGKFETL